MLVVSTIGGRICGQRAPSRSAAPWKIVLAVCLACLLFTCGCRTSSKQYVQNGYKVGPNYCTPEAEVASGWIDYQDSRVNSNEPVAGDWWQVFNDPGLNTLMKLAKEQNLTLQEASFRILEARNRRDIVAGNLLPQTQTMGGGVRNQQLSLAAGYPSGGAGGLPAGTDRQFNVWSSGPLLAWELDFWGRFRRAVESADADLGAAVSNFDNVLVILYSDVASTYLQIRIAEQRLKYAKANVEIQKRSLEMAETRKEHGKASNLDIAQGVSNLSATEAIVPELESQLRPGENRLCVLLGRAPTDIRSLVEETVEIPKVAPQIALGIPAELLRRRPDVRQAERELAARIVREGHLLENHSYAHSNATNFFTVTRLKADLAQAQATIQQATGNAPTLFRPPMGLSNPRVFRAAQGLGLQVIGWSARGLDTQSHDPERIVARIVRQLDSGAIILLHDGNIPAERLVVTVKLLLAKLKEHRYEIVRLDKMLK